LPGHACEVQESRIAPAVETRTIEAAEPAETYTLCPSGLSVRPSAPRMPVTVFLTCPVREVIRTLLPAEIQTSEPTARTSVARSVPGRANRSGVAVATPAARAGVAGSELRAVAASTVVTRDAARRAREARGVV
jgi:hypothetical protein